MCDDRIEQYLDAATSGLADDRELQLDVRAELRSHIEERLQADPKHGAASDDPLAAMGPAAELGGDLLDANRARMRWRALLRHVAQWVLVPLSVIVAVLTWNPETSPRLIAAFTQLNTGTWDTSTGPTARLTPEQRLLIRGDRSRTDEVGIQKAIWERWPTDRAFAHHYLTTVLGESGSMLDTNGYRDLEQVVESVRPMDPDNARFDYILAERLARQAAELAHEDAPTNRVARPRELLRVTDRAKFDQAMSVLASGLSKPAYGRYSGEMLGRRMAILCPPATVSEQVFAIGLAAGTSLPDVSIMRHLARLSTRYADLLAAEGRAAEARVFLGAPERLCIQMNADSWCLIDVLVAGTIAREAVAAVPAVYEQVGDAAAAERARSRLQALAAPLAEWRSRRQADDPEVRLADRMSILCLMLLPALGNEPLEAAELKPARMVEYAVADSVGVSLLSMLLLLGTAVSVTETLVARMRGAAPLLLLPSWGSTVRILACGVVLPLAVFYAISRLSSAGGREYGMAFNLPRLGIQAIVAMWAILWIPRELVRREVRRRCQMLLIPVPGDRPLARRAAVAVMAVLGGVSLLPIRRLLLPVTGWDVAMEAWLAVLVAFGVGLVAALVWSRVVYVREWRQSRLYVGSRSRSLIPVYALALILLSLMTRPVLKSEERSWLACDTVMGLDVSGGFTGRESRVTNRLKQEMARVAASLAP